MHCFCVREKAAENQSEPADPLFFLSAFLSRQRFSRAAGFALNTTGKSQPIDDHAT